MSRNGRRYFPTRSCTDSVTKMRPLSMNAIESASRSTSSMSCDEIERRPVVLAGQLEERANQLVPRERIEAAERLVEHDELWSERERDEQRRLHAHAAGKRPHGKPARQIEIPLKLAAQLVVPRRIEAGARKQ